MQCALSRAVTRKLDSLECKESMSTLFITNCCTFFMFGGFRLYFLRKPLHGGLSHVNFPFSLASYFHSLLLEPWRQVWEDAATVCPSRRELMSVQLPTFLLELTSGGYFPNTAKSKIRNVSLNRLHKLDLKIKCE